MFPTNILCIRDKLLLINPKWRSRKITDDEKNNLISFFDCDLLEAIYRCVNVIETPPVCALPGCNEPVSFFGNRYADTCCHEHRFLLSNDNGNMAEKRKQTCLEKYGVENAAQLKSTQEKRTKTLQEKYGKKVSPDSYKKILERVDNFIEKSKETIKNKYGVANPSQIGGHYEKCLSTLIENYGCDHYSKTEESKIKREQHRIEYYSEIVPNTILVKDCVNPSNILQEKYDNPNYRIEFQCSICNSTEIIPSETFKFRTRTFGTPCSTCAGIETGSSVAEKEIYKYLSDLGLNGELHNRDIISPQEIDMVFEDNKIAIEYCGLYWHNTDRLGANYHIDKLKKLEAKGYRLITIFEDEWIHKQDIVKSRLKHIFGITDSRIFGRKCSICEISTSDARNFINKYHLQGYQNASIKFGLYHGSVLVAVMTFCKPNIAKGHRENTENVWELSRFCSSVHIIGGASKLLQHFIKTYQPTEIITYADKRWSIGNVYEKLGFTNSHSSKPNYWYISNNKRIHRFALRKNKDDDQSLTEWENRKKQGWKIIHDCGNICYKMTCNKKTG